MCQFPLFETLAIIDGKFQNVFFHQQRVNFAFKYYFKSEVILFIEKIAIPAQYQKGFFRCRINYSPKEFNVEFFTYKAKVIKSFQCVYVDNFDYQFKYSDRQKLNELNQQQSDEVIIINNGNVTDCRIANLLFLKNNQWYSSQDYLLKGTQLSYLLDKGEVQLTHIKAADLFSYEKIMWINALNPFDPQRAITISSKTIFV